MAVRSNEARRRNFPFWFDPRARQVGTLAFIMNRLSGIGLTVYLFLHLVMLSRLAVGAEAYDGFIALVKNPIFLAGEYVVVVAGFLHGANGLRIAMTGVGIGAGRQRQLLYSLMTLALVGSLVFAIRMFGGE